MRISKLLRISLRLGSERKLFPEIFAFGGGNRAASRAARGSIKTLGKMLVGAPAPFTAMGTPHKPLGFRPDCCVSLVLKISPTNVGWPLLSSAGWPVGLPRESTA